MPRFKALQARAPRMFDWFLYALVLVAIVAAVAPQNIPVVVYKLALVSLAGLMGYRLDRSLFPYARPDQCAESVTGAAMLRRAIIVAAFMIAVSLGL